MRVLDAQALAALDSGRFHSRNAFHVAMDAGTFALWDDAYDITIDGITYLRGAGAFTISAFPSAGDLAVRSVDVTLSGLDSRIANDVMGSGWHQKPISILRIVMAADAPSVIYAKTWFAGFLDVIEWKERPGGSSDLVARCEDIGRELSRQGSRTRNMTDQRQLFTDDAFFDGVTAAVNTDVVWGRTAPGPVPQRQKLFGIF